MQIVQPYSKIVRMMGMDGIAMLRFVEESGRISHMAEANMTDDSWVRFIENWVMDKGDMSIIEHSAVTVDFLVDRGITHEIVRHRLFSYTQESTRFCNYSKDKFGKEIKVIQPPDLDPDAYEIWRNGVSQAENNYFALLDKVKRPEIARSLLPNSLASKIRMTGNLRNWRHVLLMRSTKETHPQAREVFIPLVKEFQAKIPILFADIVPEQNQHTALRNLR